jgi:hypothetical protein
MRMHQPHRTSDGQNQIKTPTVAKSKINRPILLAPLKLAKRFIIRHGGYLLHSPSPYRMWFRVGFDSGVKDPSQGNRLDCQGLLHEAEEELAATFGPPPIESERKLVQVDQASAVQTDTLGRPLRSGSGHRIPSSSEDSLPSPHTRDWGLVSQADTHLRQFGRLFSI